jgi:hypothetical protein
MWANRSRGDGSTTANPDGISLAEIAQSVEHRSEKPGVASSILALGTLFSRLRPPRGRRGLPHVIPSAPSTIVHRPDPSSYRTRVRCPGGGVFWQSRNATDAEGPRMRVLRGVSVAAEQLGVNTIIRARSDDRTCGSRMSSDGIGYQLLNSSVCWSCNASAAQSAKSLGPRARRQNERRTKRTFSNIFVSTTIT